MNHHFSPLVSGLSAAITSRLLVYSVSKLLALGLLHEWFLTLTIGISRRHRNFVNFYSYSFISIEACCFPNF